MELVIAVILVIILFVKINSDKEAKRSACERFDEKQRKISEWKARVTDRNLERQLKAFIQNPENKETVSMTVSPVYDSIWRDKDFSDLFPKDRWCRRKDDWTLEYHEQVQRDDADRSSSYSQNVMSSGISADSPLTAYVLIWCAKELEKQGIGNRFVVPSIGKYGAGGCVQSAAERKLKAATEQKINIERTNYACQAGENGKKS